MKPWFLAQLSLGVFVLGTELFVFGGILPDVSSDLNVSPAVGGQLVSAFGLAYAFGAPVLSSIFTRFRRRTLLIGSMVAFTLTNLATAGASTFPVLLALRVVSALAASLFIPNAVALVAEQSETKTRGQNLGIVMGGLSLATVLGVPLGIGINAVWGWRWVFVLIAALSLVAAGLTLTMPPGHPGQRVPWKTRLAPLVHGPTIWTLLTTMVVILAAFAPYTYLVFVLKNPASLDEFTFASGLSLYGATGILGAWLGGKVADRWGSQIALRLSVGGLLLIFVALGGGVNGPGPAFFTLAAWGALGSAFTPIQQHRLIDVSTGVPAAALALNSSAVYLGQTLAAALGALILATLGARAIPWASATILGVTLLLTLVGPRLSRPGSLRWLPARPK